MHGLDREHVQPTKRIVNVDDRCHGDRNLAALSYRTSMNADHDIQVFVFVPEKRFIKGILEERKDSDAISRSVCRHRLGDRDC